MVELKCSTRKVKGGECCLFWDGEWTLHEEVSIGLLKESEGSPSSDGAGLYCDQDGWTWENCTPLSDILPTVYHAGNVQLIDKEKCGKPVEAWDTRGDGAWKIGLLQEITNCPEKPFQILFPDTHATIHTPLIREVNAVALTGREIRDKFNIPADTTILLCDM